MAEIRQTALNLGRIVSTHHSDRLVKLLESGTIVHGASRSKRAFHRANRPDERFAGLPGDAGRNFGPICQSWKSIAFMK